MNKIVMLAVMMVMVLVDAVVYACFLPVPVWSGNSWRFRHFGGAISSSRNGTEGVS